MCDGFPLVMMAGVTGKTSRFQYLLVLIKCRQFLFFLFFSIRFASFSAESLIAVLVHKGVVTIFMFSPLTPCRMLSEAEIEAHLIAIAERE